jgi:protein ImuB
MPLAEAQALARDLQSAPLDPPADRRVLEQLAEACEQFTPCVAIEEGDAPESLLLDISNLEHLWGSETKLAARVRNFFTRRGYHVRLAVADTVGLAWALAHFAKMTNEKPVSSFVIRHSSFQNLPVESLRISPDTAALLRELGIETIGQLLALPRDGLAQRFGDELLRRLDQLTGAAREVIEPHRALAPWKAVCSLEEPTADRAVIMHVFSQLVSRLTRRLATRDQGAVQLVCTLGSPGNHAMPFQIGLLEPTANPQQLLELIDLHLEQITLADEVDRVEIRATVVGRLGERQHELFESRWPTDSHQLALLANRLTSRLGSERVLRAELRASPVPERAVRYIPLTRRREGERGRRGEGETKKWRSSCRNLPLSPSPCLPFLLHPQLQPLEVVSVAPDGPPQFVWLNRRRQRVVYHAGPERIETLWWRGRSVRRDYYRIATEEGTHMWIYRDLTTAKWYLHGEFQ